MKKKVETCIRSFYFIDNSRFNEYRCAAYVVNDIREKSIVEAVVEAARDAGINELYLMDRQFVLDALTEKIERDWEHETRDPDCSL